MITRSSAVVCVEIRPGRFPDQAPIGPLRESLHRLADRGESAVQRSGGLPQIPLGLVTRCKDQPPGRDGWPTLSFENDSPGVVLDRTEGRSIKNPQPFSMGMREQSVGETKNVDLGRDSWRSDRS